MPEAPVPSPSLRRQFRNWVSWIGMVLIASSLFSFLFLVAIDQFAGHRNPYVGILAYVVAPIFFLLGFGLSVIGALFQRRSERTLVRAEPARDQDRSFPAA